MGRYAIKTPTHHTTWDKMLEVWTAADATEVFESAWNFDHFYPIRGDTNGPCLEAWVTLSALAQATTPDPAGDDGVRDALSASGGDCLDGLIAGHRLQRPSRARAWGQAGTRSKPMPTGWTWGRSTSG